MALDRPGTCFLDLDSHGMLIRRIGLAYSAGQVDAYKLVMTNTEGVIDQTLLPDNLHPGTPILAAVSLAAGDWVSLIYDNGRRKAVKATGVGSDRPPVGFVTEAYASNEYALIYFSGMNSRVVPDGTGLTATDVGKDIFLSYATPGKSISQTALATAWAAGTIPLGAVLYNLGHVVEFSTTAMRVTFLPKGAVGMQAQTT